VRTGRGVQALALGGDGDLAIVANADAGLLAPDEGPPGAGRDGADDGVLLGEGLVVGLERGAAEAAVDFVLVGVGDELVEQVVGADQFDDVVGGEEGDEAFLPVVVAAFNFTFGLRGGGVAQLHAVEAEGLAELGEGVGVVGVEEGVVVDVEGQGQAVSLKDAGEEVEVGQEGFAGVEAGAGVEASGVVEDVQEDLFVGGAGEPGVRAGIVLPEGAVVAGLPAFDGLGGLLVARVGGETVGEGPAADGGAVGSDLESAVEFAGGGAVAAGRFGGQEFGEEGGGFGGPVRMVITAGTAWRPSVGAALGTGPEVVGAELVAAAEAQAQFHGEGLERQIAGAGLGKELTDPRRGDPVSELEFFIGAG